MHEMQEIEGTMEVQNMLLQKLARQENAVKGLTSLSLGRDSGGQSILGSVLPTLTSSALPESTGSASDADLETSRKEVALAISTIWRKE